MFDVLMFGDVRDVNDVDVRRKLMESLREALRESLRKIGLKSDTYIDSLINEILKLDVNDVDIEKYNFWFSYWVKELKRDKITSLGRYFYRVFEKQLENGTFKASDTSPTPTTTIKDLSVEDFEKEWDEWCRLVRELSIPPEPDVPGKGTVIGELHCVDGVRGISTGDGGFVYLDGTVSQRFKRFEDLSIQEKEDLINAFEERNSRPGLGRLIIADALLEKMRSLAGGSAV